MTAPALPDPDAILLQLDKLAREYNSYEYGLPFMGGGVTGDELPLSSYYEEDRALDGLRDVLREFGQQCYEAGVAQAIASALERIDEDRWDPGRSAEYREGYFQGVRDCEDAIRKGHRA